MRIDEKRVRKEAYTDKLNLLASPNLAQLEYTNLYFPEPKIHLGCILLEPQLKLICILPTSKPTLEEAGCQAGPFLENLCFKSTTEFPSSMSMLRI